MLTEGEMSLIVKWLTEPKSFDFLDEGNRSLVRRAEALLAGLPSKRLMWARYLEFVEPGTVRRAPGAHEPVEAWVDAKGDLKVTRIGGDGDWNYEDFVDWQPLISPS